MKPKTPKPPDPPPNDDESTSASDSSSVPLRVDEDASSDSLDLSLAKSPPSPASSGGTQPKKSISTGVGSKGSSSSSHEDPSPCGVDNCEQAGFADEKKWVDHLNQEHPVANQSPDLINQILNGNIGPFMTFSPKLCVHCQAIWVKKSHHCPQNPQQRPPDVAPDISEGTQASAEDEVLLWTEANCKFMEEISWQDLAKVTVPKITRFAGFDRRISTLFSNIVKKSPSVDLQFKAIYLFPGWVLEGRSNLKSFQKRIERIENGEWETRHNEMMTHLLTQAQARLGTNNTLSQTMAFLRAGEVSKAAKALTNEKPILSSTVARDCARSKFPQVSSLEADCTSAKLTPFEPKEVSKVLKGSAKLSHPGPDGWTYELMLAIASTDRGMKCLANLATHLASGNYKDHLESLLPLLNARLFIFDKGSKDEELDVRPIACAGLWRRLPAKLLSNKHLADISHFLKPLQFGVGVSGGSEAVVHLVQLERERHQDYAFLKLDLRNAFGSIRRGDIHKALSNHFPDLIPWFMISYGRPIDLKLTSERGVEDIGCMEGVLQGDPLGPAFFALGFHQNLLEINKFLHEEDKSGNSWATAVLDDVIIKLRPQDIKKVWDHCRKTLDGNGLVAKHSKCKVLEPLSEPLQKDYLPADLRSARSIKLLGTVIGEDERVKELYSDVVKNSRHLMDKVVEFSRSDRNGATQGAFAILRHAVPNRLTFLLRTCEKPDLIKEAAQAFDRKMRTTLTQILGHGTLEDSQYLQATFPVGKGGFGLRSAERAIWPAFVGSWALSLDLFANNAFVTGAMLKNFLPKDNHLAKSLEQGQEYYARRLSELGSPFFENGKPMIPDFRFRPNEAATKQELQKRLTKANQKSLIQEFIDNRHDSLDGESLKIFKARWKSVCGVGGGDLIQALPTQRALTIPNKAFRYAMSNHFGKLPSEFRHQYQNQICTCSAGKDKSYLEIYHLEVCLKGGGQTYRHDRVCDVFKTAFKNIGCSVSSELLSFKKTHKSQKRLDIEVQFNDKAYQFDSLGLDISFTQPCAKSTRNTDAILAREKEKNKRYAKKCHDIGMTFIPVVFETFGRIGAPALRLIRNMFRSRKVDKLKWEPNWTAPQPYNVFRQQLAVSHHHNTYRHAKAVQRGLKPAPVH